MGKRIRLTDEEAEFLGRDINPKFGAGNPKYRISDEEFQSLEDFRSTTTTKGYLPTNNISALHNGRILSKEEFCQKHGIDINTIHSAKLVTHTATPYYNIAFKDQEQEVDFNEASEILKGFLGKYTIKTNKSDYKRSKEAVLIISDLHLGAYVDGLIRTQEFSISILVDKLKKIADYVNDLGYQKVHIHFLGDMIESFTGLNHKNSWKNLGKGMFGVEVVKLCVDILSNFLSSINNVERIKIVGGNHDRVTSDKSEDTAAGAANLISWGLGLLGWDTEFNSIILTHKVDGINHILTHGHHILSKRNTKEIVWDYGEKGVFNFVQEGHLHSRIQKLTTKANFQTLKDDSVDCRRQICPSLFTGNSYSEELGYTTTSGFLIIENNGEGIPNVFDIAV